MNDDFYRDAMLVQYMPYRVSHVCLSEVGVLLKRLNIGSCKQHHAITQGL